MDYSVFFVTGTAHGAVAAIASAAAFARFFILDQDRNGDSNDRGKRQKDDDGPYVFDEPAHLITSFPRRLSFWYNRLRLYTS